MDKILLYITTRGANVLYEEVFYVKLKNISHTAATRYRCRRTYYMALKSVWYLMKTKEALTNLIDPVLQGNNNYSDHQIDQEQKL